MQAMTEASADPPVMKNAGQLVPYGSTGVVLGLTFVGVGALVLGGMLLAVMISHGQRSRGWVLHAVLGGAALVLLLLALVVDPFVTLADVVGAVVGVGVLWLVVAGMAFLVGSLVQPHAKRRRVPERA